VLRPKDGPLAVAFRDPVRLRRGILQPGRIALLVALLEGGEVCVCDLAATTGLSESVVSHALRLLRAHRVVAVRRDRRMAFYRLADAHVRLLLDVGLTHTGHARAVHVEHGASE